MGYFDADGYLFIVGRRNDQMKYLHHIISPIEVESVLEKHPDIQRVAVVGVSVPVYNDLPAAVCLRHPGSSVDAKQLNDWLEGKLPENQQLRGGIYFVDELPMTANGKVRKVVCKDWAFRWFHEKHGGRREA